MLPESLAVAVDAIRDLIDHTSTSRALDAQTKRALLFARDTVSLLWDVLAAELERDGEYQRDCVQLFESCPDACVVTDANATVRHANRAALALLGVPAAQLLHKPLGAFFPSDQLSSMPGYLLQLITRTADGPALRWRTIVRGSRAGVEVEARVLELGRLQGRVQGLCWLLKPAVPLHADIVVPQAAVGGELGGSAVPGDAPALDDRVSVGEPH